MKTHIFGDTGGHLKQLFVSLEQIGVDLKNYKIPENIRIIHLGDLIHKGPSPANAILTRVDKLIRNNPGQWIQLFGNHELQHLEGSPWFWRCKCSPEDFDILETWWDEGLAFSAYGIDSFTSLHLEVSKKPKIVIPDTGILFTHAGLTHHWWKTHCDGLTSAIEVSKKINAQPIDVVTTPGTLLQGSRMKPGPIWAVSESEVFQSWDENPDDIMPFIQFHGHTAPYNFPNNRWFIKNANPELRKHRAVTKVNPETRTTITKLNGSLVIGIDPCFEFTADIGFQPYQVLESAE